MNSTTIYFNLCYYRSNQKDKHIPGSNLHRHHIIPRHMGGLDEEANYTYLTVKEHILAHYLLWRIHKNPNDLRSMKMLGAKLSSKQRSIIGKFCAENEIGFHDKKYDDVRKEWVIKGVNTQIENKIGIHNPKNFKKYASLGGKASIKSKNNPWSYWASPEGRSKRASLGGKALKGLICVTNGKHRTRIKPESLKEYIDKGYVRGFKLFS